MPSCSLGSNHYFFLLTDDFTRMSWVCLIQKKSESLKKFKEFKAKVEGESGLRLMTLRTDCGGEFCSKEFDSFYHEHGIHLELTTPHTPEQNRVAERKNRTVVEMMRSMLNGKKMSDEFWGEAVVTTVYLLDLSQLKLLIRKLLMKHGLGINHP
jgi:transposase InsO family protein